MLRAILPKTDLHAKLMLYLYRDLQILSHMF